MASKKHDAPSWTRTEIPEDAIDRILSLYDFFVMRSPCNYQSTRQIPLKEYGWRPNMWQDTRYLKRELNLKLFKKGESTILNARSRNALSELLGSMDLDDGFWMRRDKPRVACAKAPNPGNSSEYMSLFYHLRNSLAHGRFAVFAEESGRHTFVFEDYSSVITARGVLGLNDLLDVVAFLVAGPDQPGRLEDAIIDALLAGSNKRHQIIRDLQITQNDWKVYSGVLKEEGKIEYSKRERVWRVADAVCENAAHP